MATLGHTSRPQHTIYDTFPLSLRSLLQDAPSAATSSPPLARQRSLHEPRTRVASDCDEDYAHTEPVGVNAALELSDASPVGHQKRPGTRPSSLCSTFGKFHNEVFETKERSKVLSALRHRGKATTGATARARARAGGRPTVSRPVPNTFTADDVLRAGTLTKQGSWRRNWKTRFFILRSDCPSLCYFTSEEKLELLGEIPVTEDTLVLDRSVGGHAPYRFQIRTEDQTLLLEAESRDNQRRWIDSCQELADAVRASKFSVATSTSMCSVPGGDRRSSLAALGGMSTSTSAAALAARQRQEKENQPSQIESSACSSPEDNESDLDSSDDAQSSGQSLRPTHRRRRRSKRQLTASSASSSQSQAKSQTADANVGFSGSSARLYDLSISVLVGRRSRLARAVEPASGASERDRERLGCFVVVSGLSRSGSSVELGVTDAVKLSTVVAASSALATVSGEPVPIPFSVVLTAELESFHQLRLTLCQTQLAQSPGNVQATLGVGRCQLDESVLAAIPHAVTIAERDALAGQAVHVDGEAASALAPCGGSNASLSADSDRVQLVVQAFQSLAPQRVLPTTGVDMANAKYLIPTTLAPGRETTAKLRATGGGTRFNFATTGRGSDVRSLLDCDSFLSSSALALGNGTGGDATSGHVRFVAVDEILRVPRSTFALPVAYLDFLEEQALARSRWLHRQLKARVTVAGAARSRESQRLDAELEFLRKKQEEYLKQRTFLMRQERRLLDEQQDRKFFQAAKHAVVASAGVDKDSGENPNGGGNAGHGTAAADGEPVAPFKRSTYKNLNLWQFLPTNMQDQFLSTYKPPTTGSNGADSIASRPFVWHTMTMGCPAAHTKGFANGGYPASAPLMSVNPTAAPEEEALLAGVTSPTGSSSSSSSRGGGGTGGSSSGSTSTGSAPAVAEDSLQALKLRLELQDRLTVIGSQILSATAACLLATLDLAVADSALHQTQLDRAPHVGYLMNFESLLSTQGKEFGMLEDFAAGARWLRRVFIQFRKHGNSGSFFSFKKHALPEGENGEGLLLTMGLSETHMSVLPLALAAGEPLRVHCVLFSQGVNEKQSLVHAYKASAVKLQERVNRENLAELKRIYARYRRLRVEEAESRVLASRQLRARASGALRDSVDADEAAMALGKHDLEALDDLLVQIEHHICSPTSQYKKNVALLMDSSDFCRALGGARVTCCKSGKDRTAMSVTLEQARLLCAELQATQGAALCANMRLYGVRRRNVFMNTKADKFAFNEMQRKMLPDCYKPPAGTYKSGKT